MIKPVGPSVLIKVKKRKSAIQLLNETALNEEAEAVIAELGTVSTLGLQVGDSIMLKHTTQPVIVEQTEEEDLLIVPEVSVLYVKNYDRD